MRRDFAIILNLIKAHAILHQASRDRDPEGLIIATLEDYAVVRELVGDLISEGVEFSVSQAIRETVAAVKVIIHEGDRGKEGATVAEVAMHLKIDKSAASRRVKTATEKGYLRNLESRRGLPAKLVLGDPLPEPQDLLPSPERLTCCTGAAEESYPLPAPCPPQLNPLEGQLA